MNAEEALAFAATLPNPPPFPNGTWSPWLYDERSCMVVRYLTVDGKKRGGTRVDANPVAVIPPEWVERCYESTMDAVRKMIEDETRAQKNGETCSL